MGLAFINSAIYIKSTANGVTTRVAMYIGNGRTYTSWQKDFIIRCILALCYFNIYYIFKQIMSWLPECNSTFRVYNI